MVLARTRSCRTGLSEKLLGRVLLRLRPRLLPSWVQPSVPWKRGWALGCARQRQARATWVPPLLAGRWFLPIFTGGFASGSSVASANCRRGRGPLRGQGASRSGPPTPIRPRSCVSTSPRLQAQRWVCLPHPPCGHLRKPRAPPLEQASPQPGPLWSVPIWKAPPTLPSLSTGAGPAS